MMYKPFLACIDVIGKRKNAVIRHVRVEHQHICVKNIQRRIDLVQRCIKMVYIIPKTLVEDENIIIIESAITIANAHIR